MEVELGALRPHVERDAVFRVHTDVPLVKAALAVSLDLADDVKGWMTSGELQPVTTEVLDSQPSTTRIRFLIVQPFVLIQALERDAPIKRFTMS